MNDGEQFCEFCFLFINFLGRLGFEVNFFYISLYFFRNIFELQFLFKLKINGVYLVVVVWRYLILFIFMVFFFVDMLVKFINIFNF